jgi:hypothetical protein
MKNQDDSFDDLSESTEAKIQSLEETIEKGIGTNRELIFDPEFQKIFISSYPYFLALFYAGLWVAAYFFPKGFDIPVLFLFTVIVFISTILTTFYQSKIILKLNVINRALKLHQQNRESREKK